ncbi:MAG: 16S rRNA (guanine(527)-N(7))-methyltransferase RsmG [Candidatus Nanopelagicaceae bacterium]
MKHFPEREAEALAYAEFLKGPGIERGLIGPREADRIWERHILNCIPVSTLMKEGASVIDIGSGAGLPGVVIALARPDLKVTLLEPLQRRVTFLEEAVTGLGITVKRGKAELEKGQYDYVTARAVAPLSKLWTISKHLIKPGGSLLAMKGEAAAAEAAEIPGAIVHEIELEGIPLARVVEVKR